MAFRSAVGAYVVVSVIDVSVRFFGQQVVVGYHGTAFAHGDDFGEIEGEAAHAAESPYGFSVVGGSGSLAGILDEDQVVFAANGHQFVEVGLRAAHVYGHDGFGAGGDGALYGRRVEGEGVIDVHQDGNGTQGEDGLEGGHEGKGGHDHFVAGADPAYGQGRRYGGGAAGGELGMAGAEFFAQGFFHFEGLVDSAALVLKSVTHQDAGFHDIHYFLFFRLVESFVSGHVISVFLVIFSVFAIRAKLINPCGIFSPRGVVFLLTKG